MTHSKHKPHFSRFVVPAIAIGSLLALSACSAGGDDAGGTEGDPFSGDLNVQVYGDWPFVQDNAESFMELHPDAKITVGGITNEDLRSNGGRLFTSSDSPDIVSYTLQDALMEDWIEAGALTPLDDVWEKTDMASDVSETSVDLATAADGKKYAVPLGLTLLPYAFYNTDAWAAAGGTAPDPDTHEFTSLDDFDASLAAVKDAGLIPLNTPGSPFGEYMFGSLLQSSCGTDLYTEISLNWQAEDDSAPSYTEDCVVTAIQQMVDWSDAGYFPDGIDSLTFEQSQTLFDTGKAATWIMGSWVPPVFTPANFKWDWALLPSLGEEPSAHGISLDSFLVPSGAKNPALAKEFIAYMTSKEVLEQGMGRVPARENVDLSKVIKDPISASIAASLATSPQAPGWFTLIPTSVEQAFSQDVISGAMAGSQTAAEAAQSLQDASEEYRGQR